METTAEGTKPTLFLNKSNPLLDFRDGVLRALKLSQSFSLLGKGPQARVVNKVMVDAAEIWQANGVEFLESWWGFVVPQLKTAYWLANGLNPKNVYSVWSAIRARASERVRVGRPVSAVSVRSKGAW